MESEGSRSDRSIIADDDSLQWDPIADVGYQPVRPPDDFDDMQQSTQTDDPPEMQLDTPFLGTKRELDETQFSLGGEPDSPTRPYNLRSRKKTKQDEF